MEKDAKKMRDDLFETLFTEDGITLSELMSYLNPYIELWNQLHISLEKSVEHFDWFSSLDAIKLIDNKYLIIKEHIWSYLIIDINSKKVLEKDDIIELFNEQFFVDNFNEEKTNPDNQKFKFYHFLSFKNDVQPFIDLYNNNKEIFEGPTKIFYKNSINEAYIYLSINLITGNLQIGFETKDQFLYEQLFIRQDLTPFGMQDATSKIGRDKMNEMFARIKDIKVPIKYIPEEILRGIGVEASLSNQLESKDKRISLIKM